MSKNIEEHGRDRALWEALGTDEAPQLDRPLWPDVHDRVYGRKRGGWLPRLGFAGAGGLCALTGLWLGLNLASVESTVSSVTDVAVSGSFLDDDAWSLAAMYLAAAGTTEDEGSAQ